MGWKEINKTVSRILLLAVAIRNCDILESIPLHFFQDCRLAIRCREEREVFGACTVRFNFVL